MSFHVDTSIHMYMYVYVHMFICLLRCPSQTNRPPQRQRKTNGVQVDVPRSAGAWGVGGTLTFPLCLGTAHGVLDVPVPVVGSREWWLGGARAGRAGAPLGRPLVVSARSDHGARMWSEAFQLPRDGEALPGVCLHVSGHLVAGDNVIGC